MKNILGIALFLFATNAFASGGFDCSSMDGSITVNGGDSSAGTWVKSVELDGQALQKDTSFTADHIYKGANFSFLIMDQSRNVELLRVETSPVAGSLYEFVGSALKSKSDKSAAIICKFTY